MPAVLLRDRQVELTRGLILEALAGLIAEGRLAEFSVQDVADRAGVSLRTVYRHFPSRDVLLVGFKTWIAEQLRAHGDLDPPLHADEVAAYVRAKFAILQRSAALLVPLMKLDFATGAQREESSNHLTQMRSALAEVTGALDPELAEAVVWTFRMICSVQTWLAIRERGGVDAAPAGAAAAWAVEVLLEALRAGRRPHLSEEGKP